ncbi:MAG: hypothetical protein ACRDSK_10080 [Actinophytocola sp.]|uniref:hypothetical protein n=1 Tax=Actinophytocola sp. TaxID=1872138 RepID=UPI003D6A9633
MTAPVEPIEADFRQFRRGRGIREPRPLKSLSAELRTLCRIGERDDPGHAWATLVRKVSDLTARLPADLRIAAEAALALHSETENMRYLNDRIEWLRMQEECSERTARRRIEDAVKKLVVEAKRDLSQPPETFTNPDQGWYVEMLRTRLQVGRGSPRAVEERRIVVTTDGLGEIIHRANIPPGDYDRTRKRGLDMEVVYGGSMRPISSSGSHFQWGVRLPVPMNLGDTHDYGVVMRIPEGQSMVPQYVCLPLRRHDLFELRIAFDPTRLPARIWRLAGVAPRVVDDWQVIEPLLVPNKAGEVSAIFRDLRVGFGYGIQWEP